MIISKKSSRRGATFGMAAAAIVLTMASTASACVVMKGTMTVTGTSGSTVVVGNMGPALGTPCPGGEPTTAAAGPVGSTLHVKVEPTPSLSALVTDPTCFGAMPDAFYEARLRTESAYLYNGSSWQFQNGAGCFYPGVSVSDPSYDPAQFATTRNVKLGEMPVSLGLGEADFTIPPNLIANRSGEVGVFCLAVKSAPNRYVAQGNLAPFQVL